MMTGYNRAQSDTAACISSGSEYLDSRCGAEADQLAASRFWISDAKSYGQWSVTTRQQEYRVRNQEPSQAKVSVRQAEVPETQVESRALSQARVSNRSSGKESQVKIQMNTGSSHKQKELTTPAMNLSPARL